MSDGIESKLAEIESLRERAERDLREHEDLLGVLRLFFLYLDELRTLIEKDNSPPGEPTP